MKAYKLMKLRKNGTLGSLFINKKDIIPIGEWMTANDYPTKGYARRPGWHCTFKTYAPHLSMKERTWVECEVDQFVVLDRPEHQGGEWILAQRMKVNKIITL